VYGRVTISNGQGQVQSTDRSHQPDGKYQRSLTPAEVEQLSPPRLLESSQRLDGPKGPDQFVYDVHAQPGDGAPIILKFGDTATDPVGRWFIDEADRIWQARLGRK
jgi:hypothetical protein